MGYLYPFVSRLCITTPFPLFYSPLIFLTHLICSQGCYGLLILSVDNPVVLCYVWYVLHLEHPG